MSGVMKGGVVQSDNVPLDKRLRKPKYKGPLWAPGRCGSMLRKLLHIGGGLTNLDVDSKLQFNEAGSEFSEHPTVSKQGPHLSSDFDRSTSARLILARSNEPNIVMSRSELSRTEAASRTRRPLAPSGRRAS